MGWTAGVTKGRNRADPAPPRIPGTNLRSPNVPLAIIRRPARPVTQSASRPRHWVLEFEPSSAPALDPLMGWTTSADPYRSIRLTFPDVASAIRFAEANDWRYIVFEDEPRAQAGTHHHRLHMGGGCRGDEEAPLQGRGAGAHRPPDGHKRPGRSGRGSVTRVLPRLRPAGPERHQHRPAARRTLMPVGFRYNGSSNRRAQGRSPALGPARTDRGIPPP
ncbi:ETC complex I subunit [Paracoccus bogoriensis]|uniref:NADH dehydrogenase ubiquinone Fe-S protein 4 n=1 Tax=Paracoccus bogoriensis TaxID=242065 RepID=UPI001C674D65|nr:NADH dehydrogenase ubiquinone Fe-S protein 4 [Paracoccus bogoriensis]MBW7056113.1 ETC complex I subunit [Paracoccus bogoriensis]